MNYRFRQAIIAGTFDHLHSGHKQFIAAAYAQSEHVHVNISLRKLTKHKPFMQSIQPYSVRKKILKAYLSEQKLLNRTIFHALEDTFGMALTDTTCDAIFVTQATKPTAIRINNERKKSNLTPLTIVTVPLRRGDDQKIISSKRIRSGETDREGNSYTAFFLGKKQYLLPEALRHKLQKPIGRVITDIIKLRPLLKKSSILISVGDIVSRSLLEADYTPKVAVIDYQTRRHPLEKTALPVPLRTPWRTITNPHGTINKQFASYFREALTLPKGPQVIAVDGEEDLLALPALLLSPIDSIVIYGQYDTGMVVVRVTEEIKAYARNILASF